MRILVTGACGFVGANIVKYMAATHPEAEIVVADTAELASLARIGDCWTKRLSYLSLDVCDVAACRATMELVRPTYIVHAAAVTLSDESATSSELTIAVNLEGTRNILSAATSAGSVQRAVLLSSGGVYMQNCNALPCDEEHPLDLSTGYARTKRKSEMMMAGYEAIGGFPILAVRVGPVYGQFERASAARPDVSLIQRLLGFLFEGRSITVAGTDMVRDWTHAEDVVQALDALLFTAVLKHRIYNVSSGVSVSALAILDVFVQHGLRLLLVESIEQADIFLDPREDRKPLAIVRLQNETSFMPRFDIERGIAEVIRAQLGR